VRSADARFPASRHGGQGSAHGGRGRPWSWSSPCPVTSDRPCPPTRVILDFPCLRTSDRIRKCPEALFRIRWNASRRSRARRGRRECGVGEWAADAPSALLERLGAVVIRSGPETVLARGIHNPATARRHRRGRPGPGGRTLTRGPAGRRRRTARARGRREVAAGGPAAIRRGSGPGMGLGPAVEPTAPAPSRR
jgi:hypothetical protein